MVTASRSLNEVLTEEKAIAFYESGAWQQMSDRQRAEFQLLAERLCMPFSVFHESVEKALGRSVWTHEFVDPDGLLKELRGDREAPTFEEILDLIPEKKRVVIGIAPER